MIRLTVNDTILDLPQRASVTIQGFNPALDEDGMERTFSFPFRLDATGRNLQALGYINRLDTDLDVILLPATFQIDSAYFVGKLEINSRTSNTIEVVFKSEGRAFMEAVDEIKINEILATIPIPNTVEVSWDITFEGEPPAQRQLKINGVDYGGVDVTTTALVAQINADYPDVALWIDLNRLTLTPGTISPFVVSNIETTVSVIFTNSGTSQHESFLTYLADAAATPPESHAFPVVFAPGFYRYEKTFWRGYMNYTHGANDARNEPANTRNWHCNIVPFVRIPYILDRLKDAVGLEVWAGFFADADFQRLLAWNNYALDQVIQDVFDGLTLQFLNAYKTEIVLNQHVPAITGRELLAAFAAFFNLYYEKVGNTVTAKLKRKQLDNVPIDWTDKVTGDHDLLMKTRGGAILKFAVKQVGDTTIVPGQLEDYTVLDPGTNIVQVPFRPLNDVLRPDPLTESDWRNGYTAHSGTSDEIVKTDAGLRLMFDFGQQLDSEGETYWMSSRGRLNMAGDAITDFNLDWPGENGLYEKFWKGWAELIANAPSFKLPMRLEGHEIEEMNRWDNPLRYFRTPYGTVRAIIKSFDHRRSLSGGKSETTVEFLRL